MTKTSMILLASSALFLLASPSFGQERNFDFDKIRSLAVHSGIEVTINYGEPQVVLANASAEDDFDNLEISMEDGKLTVSHSHDFWDSILNGGLLNPASRKNERIKLSLTLTEINSVLAKSAATVDVKSFSGQALSLTADSGATISLTGSSYEDLSLASSSGSNINAQGTCITLTANASTGANILTSDLTCLTVAAHSATGASISLYASEAIIANATTGGNINVYGTPNEQDISEKLGGAVQVEK